jgi:hypothetical protein
MPSSTESSETQKSCTRGSQGWMERERTTELRREQEGRTDSVEVTHSGRLAALSQNPGAKLATPRRRGGRGSVRCPPTERHGACAVGRPRPRVAWTRLWGGGRGLLQGSAASQPLRSSVGGGGLGTFPRGSVPVPPASQGLRASCGDFRFPRGRPPSRPGPSLGRRRPLPAVAPHTSTGDLRAGLCGHSHEETSEETPADGRAVRDGRGFLASSVAQTPPGTSAIFLKLYAPICLK